MNNDMEENEKELIREIAINIYEKGCIKFGEFKLKSGISSPFYIDLRRIVSFPNTLKLIANGLNNELNKLEFKHIAGIPYAGLPIAVAIGVLYKKSVIYPRKEKKRYGTSMRIEGVYNVGEKIVVIDDLITTGLSKVETIRTLSEEGLIVNDVLVLVDRRAKREIQENKPDYKIHSLLKVTELFDIYMNEKLIDKKMLASCLNFLGY